MGNPISEEVRIGAVGELLVQLRLLQYGVQAAPPIKDSGNDLIAVKGDIFRGIQVKTNRDGRPRLDGLPERYHLAAVVSLSGEGHEIRLDESMIYLLPREVIEAPDWRKNIRNFVMTEELVNKLFS